MEIPWATSFQDLQPNQECKVRVEGLQALCQFWPSVRRKGDVNYHRSKMGLLVFQWKDHSIVTMLSTVHTTAMDGDEPLVVADYISMKCVNSGDQMVS